MPLSKLQFKPGVNREITAYSNEGGWFDIDNDYYFYYSHKKFIIKLPENRGYIKIWPYQYYGDLGQSAHISLVYDFIIQE